MLDKQEKHKIHRDRERLVINHYEKKNSLLKS